MHVVEVEVGEVVDIQVAKSGKRGLGVGQSAAQRHYDEEWIFIQRIEGNMYRILWFLIIIMAAGCTLTSIDSNDNESRDDTAIFTPTGGRGDDGEVATVPTTTVTVRPTQTVAPTVTALPNTNTGNNTGNNTNTGNPQPACFPRNDWPLYTVLGGDTLASIARRVGSTSRDLTAANCLRNPDLISPGQTLRVPRLPQQPQPQPQQPGAVGYVTVNPYLSYSSSGYTVDPGLVLALTWPEARRDASRVEFYQSRGGVVTLAGTDSTPGDGAVITWSSPVNAETFVYALAYFSGGTQQTTLAPVRVTSTNTNPVDPGAVYVAPYLRLDGTRYIVASGVELTINWPNAPTTQSSRVEFWMTYAGAGNSEMIGSDTNMNDGASIRFTPQTNGVIYAVAWRSNGSTLTSRSAEVGIESRARVQGDVVPSPYVGTTGGAYGLRTGAQVTLSWPQVPTGEVSQVEFTLINENGSISSLGLDTNLNDGASVMWTVTNFGRGTIHAAAPLPGQNHEFVESRKLAVYSVDIVIVEPAVGRITASPIVRDESGLLVLQNGATVTVTWPEAPTTNEVTRVEFYFTPLAAGSPPSVIGTDTSIGDGASISYVVPAGVSGYVGARAFLADGRTSETATQVQIRGE